MTRIEDFIRFFPKSIIEFWIKLFLNLRNLYNLYPVHNLIYILFCTTKHFFDVTWNSRRFWNWNDSHRLLSGLFEKWTQLKLLGLFYDEGIFYIENLGKQICKLQKNRILFKMFLCSESSVLRTLMSEFIKVKIFIFYAIWNNNFYFRCSIFWNYSQKIRKYVLDVIWLK